MIETCTNTRGTWSMANDPEQLSATVRSAVGERAGIALVSGAAHFVAALDQPLGRGTAFVLVLSDRVVARRASGEMHSAHLRVVVSLERAVNGDVILWTPGGKVALFGMMGLPAKQVLEATYRNIEQVWRRVHADPAADSRLTSGGGGGDVSSAPTPAGQTLKGGPRPTVPPAPPRWPKPVPTEVGAIGIASRRVGGSSSGRRLVLLGFGGLLLGGMVFQASPIAGWLMFALVLLAGFAALVGAVRGDAAPPEVLNALSMLAPYRREVCAVGIGFLLGVLVLAGPPPPDTASRPTVPPTSAARAETTRPPAPPVPATREPRQERPVQIPARRTQRGYLAASTREKLEKAIEILVSGDEAALNHYLAMNPDVFDLEGGLEVYVVETRFLSGLVKLRPKGQAIEFWTNIEAIR